MPEYRRANIPGGTFFITIDTYDRHPLLLMPKARDFLHAAWEDVAGRFPFTTDAVCLLPDHIHLLMTLPEDDSDFSMRIREIKRLFTKAYLAEFGIGPTRGRSHQDKNEAAIWQRRFYEHTIRDDQDMNAHMDYIHFNPVKHGLVSQVKNWQWSSFHQYVRSGFYSIDWGEGVNIDTDGRCYGE